MSRFCILNEWIFQIAATSVAGLHAEFGQQEKQEKQEKEEEEEEEEEEKKEEEWWRRSWWLPTNRMPLLFQSLSVILFVQPQGNEYQKCAALNIKIGINFEEEESF